MFYIGDCGKGKGEGFCSTLESEMARGERAGRPVTAIADRERTGKESGKARRPARREQGAPPQDGRESPGWTFLSNHSHVLICLARDPDIRVRDVAVLIGITERAVIRIVTELEDGGYIKKERIGRRNRYNIVEDKKLRHPVEGHHSIRWLLALA